MTQPNGEQAKLSGSIAGQQFAFSTKDIIPVLLLLVGGVCGYLIWQAMDKRLDELRDNHIKMFHLSLEHAKQMDDAMDQMRKLLLTHEYNRDRPVGERLPLELPPPKAPIDPHTFTSPERVP